MKSSISTLSVCMIVKNEAGILERCLKSIKPTADEIIIVDTGSEDNTVKVAKDFGAKVILSDWRNDFSYSRNISIKEAQSQWILWLDADDFIPEESISLINNLKKDKPDKVFGMVVKNQKPNGTGTEFIQARMFPNNPSIFFENPIHEQVMPSALRLGFNLVNTAVIIEHYGYADQDCLKKKAQRNISLLLENCHKNIPDIVTCIEIADSYSIIEDKDNAEIWYNRVIHFSANDESTKAIISQAYMGLGNISNNRKMYKKAKKYLNHASELCPQRTDVLYCLAVALELNGEIERASSTLELILDMEYKPLKIGVDYRQTEIKAYLRLARLWYEHEYRDRLEKLCLRALKKLQERPEIQNMAGKVYIQLDKLVDSLHCFERSLKIAVQENIDAYIGLCIIYLKAGRKNIATQTLTKILTLFESTPRYWAFCKFSGINSELYHPPDNLSDELIDNEVNILVKTYGILENK